MTDARGSRPTGRRPSARRRPARDRAGSPPGPRGPAGRGPSAAELVVDRTWDGAPLAAAERAVARLELAGDRLVVRVDAPFHGDPPPPGPPGPTARLWEHEVVELFVAGPGPEASVPYLEVELSPHGHHLVLRLKGVRRVVEEGVEVDVRAEVRGERWRAEARLPRAWLPPPPWRAAAFAAHGAGPGRRHLASVAVPGPRPDFHRPDRFPPLRLEDAGGLEEAGGPGGAGGPAAGPPAG